MTVEHPTLKDLTKGEVIAYLYCRMIISMNVYPRVDMLDDEFGGSWEGVVQMLVLKGFLIMVNDKSLAVVV